MDFKQVLFGHLWPPGKIQPNFGFFKRGYIVYQSTRNFMLISKMYNFIYLALIFNELRTFFCERLDLGPGLFWPCFGLPNGTFHAIASSPDTTPLQNFWKKLPKLFWVITKRNLKFQLHRNSGTHFFFMTDFAPKHSFLTPRTPNFDVGRFTKIHNLRHILLYLLWKCTEICNFSQGIQKSTLESLKIKTNNSFETR